MNPGIFYLYEYNNTQKLRNVGFLKLTRYYHSCTLQLNARGVPVTYADTLKLCAFYLENNTVGATVLAEIPCTNHMVSARLNFAECQFPDGHTLNTMDGFFLPLSNGRILAATVPGILVDTEKLLSAFRNPPNSKKESDAAGNKPETEDMVSNNKDTAPEVKDQKPEPDEESAPEIQDAEPNNKNAVLPMHNLNPDIKETAPEIQNASQNTEEITPEAQETFLQEPNRRDTISNTCSTAPNDDTISPNINEEKSTCRDVSMKNNNTEPPCRDAATDNNDAEPPCRDTSMDNNNPAPSCGDITTDNNNPAPSCGDITTDNNDAEPSCRDISADTGDSETTQDTPQQSVRKIQRSDMSALPRCYWHLANNSFLLHGYHNYSHLLLVEEDGHHWLGVPGIYDSREARAARLFGFPQFTDSYNEQLQLSDEEQNSQGSFGYWCCYLK